MCPLALLGVCQWTVEQVAAEVPQVVPGSTTLVDGLALYNKPAALKLLC